MAVLAIAAGAALFTNAVGIGASVGWVVGSIVGNMLFGPRPQSTTSEGPRLGDLTVTSSTYGAPIPYAYGTVRIAGNIIWSPGLVEHKDVSSQRVGGKGGKKATQTTVSYSYSASVAVAFGEGPAVGVIRIWGDSKLIYDVGSGTEPATRMTDLVFRFYPGDEDQLPDGLIEADKGAGNVPAHRGLCYIVFDNLPLANFGNRIPNITVELVYKKTTQQYPIITWSPITHPSAGRVTDSGACAIDYNRDVVYTARGISPGALRRMQYTSMVEDRVALSSEVFTDSTAWGYGCLYCGRDGYIYLNGDGGNSRKIVRIDPNSFKEVAHFGTGSSGLSNTTTNFVYNSYFGMASCYGTNGRLDFLVCAGIFNTIGVLNVANMGYVWGAGQQLDEPKNCGIASGDIYDEKGTAYLVGGGTTYPGSANLGIYKMTVTAAASFNLLYEVSNGVTLQKLDTIPAATLVSGASAVAGCGLVGRDPTDGGLIIFVGDASGLNPLSPRLIKYVEGTGIVWNTKVPDTYNAGTSAVSSNTRLDGTTYSWIGGIGNLRTVDLRTGELTTTAGIPALYSAGYPQIFDAYSNSIVFRNGSDGGGFGSQYWKKVFLGRASANGETLANIVSDLCARVGLDTADIDVSQLTDTVPGYVVTRPSTIRAALEPLAQAYFFDGVESDYQFKFIPRGGDPVLTVYQDDMAMVDNQTGDIWQETRTQEVELPQRINVLYMDQDNDYQQAVQFDKRVTKPFPTMASANVANVELPMVLDATTAKQIAQKTLYTAWTERVSYHGMLSWTFLLLDPSDIIDVVLASGNTFHSRLVKNDIGVDFTLDMQFLAQEAATYTSNVTGDRGSGFSQQTIPGTAATRLFLLDVPLLRDIDDTVGLGSRTYYFMGGFGQPGWPGALLYKSADNVAYAEVGQNIHEVAWGTASNALGAPGNPFATDEVNSLTVYMTTGGDRLASVTQLEMLNGANAGVLLAADGTPEIIQFRDVTENTDGSFTLSSLLRGRRGTDIYTDNHGAGETFLLLETDTAEAIILSLNEIGLTRYYKGVGFNVLFEDADLETRTNTGRDLKPWAPVRFAAANASGDYHLTWERRTRLNGNMKDGTGIVPLGEDSEAYEVDILSGPGGTVKRTLSASTTAATYASANISTDFGTPPATLTARVYQLSAAIGRGFTKEATINVS